jgi:hypothetical protein
MTDEERFKQLESDLREHLQLISGLLALQMSLARTVEMLNFPASDRIDKPDGDGDAPSLDEFLERGPRLPLKPLPPAGVKIRESYWRTLLGNKQYEEKFGKKKGLDNPGK